MVIEKKPITIKKYANRRLYNTGTSTYVTLEDLAQMVKKGEDFIVLDAKTGEDITRSVLTQIIFEQEGKDGQALLPTAFLRQLIRFYGDSMQMLVPSYLEFSIDRLTGEQQNIRDQISSTFGGKAMPAGHMFTALEDQARTNMAMFSQALTMFNPFAVGGAGGVDTDTAGAPKAGAGKAEAGKSAVSAEEVQLDSMKRQLLEMQRQIDALTKRT